MKRIKLFDTIPFDKTTKQELFSHIFKYSTMHKKSLVLNMNSYGVVTYLRNKRYSEVINKSDLIYPDGWGPVVASKFFPEKLITRVNVGDFIFDLLNRIEKRKYKIYILAGKHTMLQNAIDNIKKQFPSIKICGYHHGFSLSQNSKNIINEIRSSKPDIVFVGLGIPKQEIWIDSNWESLPDAVYMGVGSVFEYVAGKTRAPIWMRDNGFEWMYRLIQEPRRLFKRYTLDNLSFAKIFIKSLVKQLLSETRFR